MLHVCHSAWLTHSRDSFFLLFVLALLAGGPIGCSGTDFGSTGLFDAGPMDATTDATDESPPAAIYIPTDSGHNDSGALETSTDSAGLCADADAPCAVPNNALDAGAGVLCADGSVACDGGCLPGDDVRNCGSCGNACATSVPNAQPACINAACTFACTAAYSLCGGACVDVQKDNGNCGSCGNACSTAVTGASSSCVSGSCKVSCTDSTKTLCGSACVSTQSDASNCGACGHGCTPGSCSGGRCQPWLISSATFPISVVSDGAYVAWFDAGNDQCFAETATTVDTSPPAFAKGSANQPGQVGAVAISNGTIACVAAGTSGNEIYFAPEGSASATGIVKVSDGTAAAYGLAMNGGGTSAYVSENGGLYTCPLTAGSTCTVNLPPSASTTLQPGNPAVTGNYLFWAEGTNGVVSRVLLAMPNAMPIVTGQGQTYGIATDGTKVYWRTTGSTITWEAADLGSSGVIPILGNYQTSAYGPVAADSKNVYFDVLSGSVDTLVYVPANATGSTQPAALYTPPNGKVILSVAAAGGAIYFGTGVSNYTGGQIWGLRFP
jgi:hypothetical protein